MAELEDIEFELNDDDDDEQSVNIMENCPSPPPPFHRTTIEQEIILEPPTTFSDKEQTMTIKDIVPFDSILFNDAKIYLLDELKPTNLPSNETKRKSEHSLFRRFVKFFRSAMVSSNTLVYDRQCEQLLILTTHPCDMSDRVHMRILYTIYCRLTNSKVVFNTIYGSHWEDIGFQTSNPETDFRSTGLFSIFCLLYFVDSMYLPLAKQIYQLSHDEQQKFPFCCIGINLANILIKYLRRRKSRADIKKLIDEKKWDNTVIDLSGKLFMALFLNFYLKWKENAYTIEYTQQVLSELEQSLLHRPRTLLLELDNYFVGKRNEK